MICIKPSQFFFHNFVFVSSDIKQTIILTETFFIIYSYNLTDFKKKPYL